MYFRLVYHYPAMGKANELRALLEDRVKSGNSSGSSKSALATTLLAPEQALIHAIQHENYAAWEAHQARIASDPNFQATGAKMQSAMSRGQTQELHSVLARFTTTKPANVIWSNTFFPVPGRGQELRRVLEERVNTSTERGSASATLLSEVFPANGANFSLAIGFPDLASLEAYQASNQANPSMQAFGAALTSLVVSVQPRVLRTLVPFPA